MCLASIPSTDEREFDLKLKGFQLRYLVRLITADVVDNARIARSNAFANYGPVESARIGADLEIGSALIALIPPEISEARQVRVARPVAEAMP